MPGNQRPTSCPRRRAGPSVLREGRGKLAAVAARQAGPCGRRAHRRSRPKNCRSCAGRRPREAGSARVLGRSNPNLRSRSSKRRARGTRHFELRPAYGRGGFFTTPVSKLHHPWDSWQHDLMDRRRDYGMVPDPGHHQACAMAAREIESSQSKVQRELRVNGRRVWFEVSISGIEAGLAARLSQKTAARR